MWKDIANILIEVLIFLGTLVTMICLIVFAFVASKMWMTICAGVGTMYTLFMYDRYRQMKNHKIP